MISKETMVRTQAAHHLDFSNLVAQLTDPELEEEGMLYYKKYMDSSLITLIVYHGSYECNMQRKQQ